MEYFNIVRILISVGTNIFSVGIFVIILRLKVELHVFHIKISDKIVMAFHSTYELYT